MIQPSDKQLTILRQAGYPNIDNVTKEEATQFLGKWFAMSKEEKAVFTAEAKMHIPNFANAEKVPSQAPKPRTDTQTGILRSVALKAAVDSMSKDLDSEKVVANAQIFERYLREGFI